MSGTTERLGLRGWIEQIGQVATLGGRFFRVLFTTRFEARTFVYQVEQLGVRSMAIAGATAIFDDIPDIPHVEPSDVAAAVAFVLERPHGVSINELTLRPTAQEE